MDSMRDFGRLVSSPLVLLIALFWLLPGFSCDASAAITASGDFSPNPLVSGPSLQVGFSSYGTLQIDGASTFTTSSMYLGVSSAGYGAVTVTDAGSLLTVSSGYVGQSGVGVLQVLAGGAVFGTGGTFEIGSNYQGRGRATVSGAGSVLQANNILRIGVQGFGSLAVEADGLVSASSTLDIGQSGQVHLDGGVLRSNNLYNSGIISGSGNVEVTSSSQFQNAGRIEARNNDRLMLSFGSSGEMQNRGEVIIDGGEIEIHHRLNNAYVGNTSGQIELSDGSLRVGVTGGTASTSPQLVNSGLLASISGENHIHGTIRNESFGMLTVTNQSLLMFHDNVEAYGGSTISISGGSTAIFLEDLRLTGGTLLADLTGAAGFGHVEVIGDLYLNGILQVQLASEYVPQIGDSFELATVSGMVIGDLNLNQLPTLAEGLSWDLAADAHILSLNVIETPITPGDFDTDGDVDGQDFLLWQRGQSPDPYSAADLSDWQTNYGANGVNVSTLAVPEPTGLLSLAVAACGLATIRGRYFF